MAVNDFLQSLDGCIHRTITTGSRLETFTSNVQAQACYRSNSYTTGYLQEFQLDVVIVVSVCTGQYQNIVIRNILLLVSQLQEIFVHLIKLVLVHFYTQYVKTMFQGSTTATGSQNDSAIVNTHILRVDDFVGLHILQHTILMNTR